MKVGKIEIFVIVKNGVLSFLNLCSILLLYLINGFELYLRKNVYSIMEDVLFGINNIIINYFVGLVNVKVYFFLFFMNVFSIYDLNVSKFNFIYIFEK